jgi:hypothetical protein
MATVSKTVLSQSITFARMADAAYLDAPAKDLRGLSKIKDERKLDDKTTGTQGFVARYNNDVVVAFRGSEATWSDWVLTNIDASMTNDHRFGLGTLHSGFADAAESVFETVRQHIAELKNDKSKVYLTGHSLGGALAVITGNRLNNDIASNRPKAIFTYGAPRVGNEVFTKSYRKNLASKTYAWIVEGDPIPRLPLTRMGFRHTSKHLLLANNTVKKVELDTSSQVKSNETNLLSGIRSFIDGVAIKHSLTGSYRPMIERYKRSLG